MITYNRIKLTQLKKETFCYTFFFRIIVSRQWFDMVSSLYAFFFILTREERREKHLLFHKQSQRKCIREEAADFG